MNSNNWNTPNALQLQQQQQNQFAFFVRCLKCRKNRRYNFAVTFLLIEIGQMIHINRRLERLFFSLALHFYPK